MKQVIMLMLSLLVICCSALKHSNNKNDIVELSVFNIKENQFSYVLETFNASLDTTFLIVPKNDFEKLKNVIEKDKTFTFHVSKMRYKVPQMEKLLVVFPPVIVYETDTIMVCKCINIKSCPNIYMFKGLL